MELETQAKSQAMWQSVITWGRTEADSQAWLGCKWDLDLCLCPEEQVKETMTAVGNH